MKRLGRGAAELLAIAENLCHHDIELELLTGPHKGVYDPSGHGAALFLLSQSCVSASDAPNFHVSSCDCRAHRYGNAADCPDRGPWGVR
ncbi:hypothetical protein ACWIGX_19325 [Streptomyces nigrescens]